MANKNIKILAIETSCDETAAAVISGCHPERSEGSHQKDSSSTIQNDNFGKPVILSNIVSSQIDLHAKTGGVVPEVASRAHIEAMIPVITEALLLARQEEITNSKLQITNKSQISNLKSENANGKSKINELNENYSAAIEYLQQNVTHIAVTVGPGLIGSLLVGYNAAKTLSYANNLPIVPINHIEGHIYSAFAEIQNSKFKIQNEGERFALGFDFPILALTVSGGHTSLTLMKDHGKYETIGQTLDDAAGEAFDKVAKLLELGYPGGPIVSKLASNHRNKISNDEFLISNQILNPKSETNSKIKHLTAKCQMPDAKIVFPRPILNDGTFNFSFSGLKTAVLQKTIDLKKIHGNKLSENIKAEICAAFEDAVIDVLTTKSLRAVEKYHPKAFVLAGGVAANSFLRNELDNRIQNLDNRVKLLMAPRNLCGDNAAMIGLAAYYHVRRKETSTWDKIMVNSNIEL